MAGCYRLSASRALPPSRWLPNSLLTNKKAGIDDIDLEDIDLEVDTADLEGELDIDTLDEDLGIEFDDLDLGDIAVDAADFSFDDYDFGGFMPDFGQDDGGFDLGGGDDWGGFDDFGGFDDW